MKLQSRLLVLVIGAVLAVAACGPMASAGTGIDVLRRAEQAAANVPAFRSVTQKSSDNSTVTAMYVPPDRAYVNSGGTETIVIKGSGVWLKRGSGEWQKAPFSDTLSQVAFTVVNPARITSILTAVVAKKFKMTGTETLNGKQMQVYQVTGSGLDSTMQGISKVWVGVDDGLPYRIDETPAGGGTATTSFEYGADIKIEPPM